MFIVTVNGKDYQSETDMVLMDFLREELRITSVKNGCKEGACGTCTVIIDGKTVRAMDVLFPKIGEIIGGSERESDYDKLVTRIEELHIPMKDMWWYLWLIYVTLFRSRVHRVTLNSNKTVSQ